MLILVALPSHSIDRIDDDRNKQPIASGNAAPSRAGAEAGNETPREGPEQAPEAAPTPSRQSLRGLDWFIFFLADVQPGFGPFIAVYLTTQKWTQVEIGFVLSIAGVVGLIGQMPGGAIIDAARWRSASGAGAMPATHRSATASPRP